MPDENAFDRRAQPGTLGAETRKLFQEMQEAIIHLQEMRDYARENGSARTEKYLSDVIDSFQQLLKKYGSAEVINEIQKSSYLPGKAASDKRIETVKAALKAAKHNDAKNEMRDILTLLRTSRFQVIYENFNDFSAQRNKFEVLIERIDNFEKTHKSKHAKNSPQFFSTQPATSQPFPQVAFAGKLKSNK